MARIGITKLDVQQARDLLLSNGKHPSVDAVRQAAGNTGSKSTIHKYLKELENDAGASPGRRLEASRSIQEFVEELAAKLHGEVNARIEELQRKHEKIQQAYEREIAAMRQEINVLKISLHEAQVAAQGLELSSDLLLLKVGYGNFEGQPALMPRSSLLNGSRNAAQYSSPYFFNSRSEIQLDTELQQGGYDMFSRR